MAQVPPVGSLEVEEDLAFHRWQSRVARALWVVLLAVMVAIALGLFGNGPLSRRRAGAADAPLWVEYDRIVRFGASVRLIVHVRPQPDGEVRFTIGRSLLEAFQVQHVTPLPSSTSVVETGVEYRFRAGVDGTVAVIFELQPATRWGVQGQVESPDGAVQLSQFVLP